MTDNYKKLQALILKSEGKTLEDELVEGSKFKVIDMEVLEFIEYEEDEVFTMIKTEKLGGGKGYCSACDSSKEFVYHPDDSRDAYLFDQGEIQILGLPVTLERVLAALGEEYTVDGKGRVREKSSYENTDFYWIMGKPLHEQTEENILKLIQILS